MKKQYQPYEVDVNTLGFYVDRLLYAMVRRRNRDLKEHGIDLQHIEFIVLKVLYSLGGASQSQLAKVMAKERSGIGRVVASLEKKGYVMVEPLNGSTNFVSVTEKGEALKPMIAKLSEDLSEVSFKGFSQKKREAFLNNLHKIYQNVIAED